MIKSGDRFVIEVEATEDGRFRIKGTDKHLFDFQLEKLPKAKKEKRYKWGEKIYCKEDLSESIENYGGNLNDLFQELAEDSAVRVVIGWRMPGSVKIYGNNYDFYGDSDYQTEMVEQEFSHLEVDDDGNMINFKGFPEDIDIPTIDKG